MKKFKGFVKIFLNNFVLDLLPFNPIGDKITEIEIKHQLRKDKIILMFNKSYHHYLYPHIVFHREHRVLDHYGIEDVEWPHQLLDGISTDKIYTLKQIQLLT